MVEKVTFLGFRGGDRPNRPPGSALALHLCCNTIAHIVCCNLRLHLWCVVLQGNFCFNF